MVDIGTGLEKLLAKEKIATPAGNRITVFRTVGTSFNDWTKLVCSWSEKYVSYSVFCFTDQVSLSKACVKGHAIWICKNLPHTESVLSCRETSRRLGEGWGACSWSLCTALVFQGCRSEWKMNHHTVWNYLLLEDTTRRAKCRYRVRLQITDRITVTWK